jgi:DnaJ-class molecular chaperone
MEYPEEDYEPEHCYDDEADGKLELDSEAGICPTCSGSGEGMHEGTTCYVCHGKGEI